jgi:hypothetical protein
LDCEPCDGAWFGVYQGHRRTQKVRDLFSLPGFACSGT